MFGTPVFIKQHGLIVDEGQIIGPVTLNASVQRTFSLLRDETILSSPVMRVQARIKVDVFATVLIAAGKNATRHTSAAALNAALRAELVEDYLNQAAEEAAEAEAEAAKPRRGRRRKDEEEDEVEDEGVDIEQKAIDYADRYATTQAFDILLSTTEIEDGDVVDVRMTEPFKKKAAISDDAAGKLERTLGRLAALVRKRGDALNSIRGGSVSNNDSINDLVPANLGGSDIQSIDQIGLRKYEESLREQANEAEEMIKKIYDSMQRNVLDGATERTFRMKEDFSVRDVSVTVESAMEELFKEIVPVRALGAK